MINPHPGLPEFEYIKPTTLDEASKFLASHEEDARPLQGAQIVLSACEMAFLN